MLHKFYSYPAKVVRDNEGYVLTFVDFPNDTPVEERNLPELWVSAKECLALYIADYMATHKGKVPLPSYSKGDIIVGTTLEGIKTFLR